jgi:hypothetical protein
VRGGSAPQARGPSSPAGPASTSTARRGREGLDTRPGRLGLTESGAAVGNAWAPAVFLDAQMRYTFVNREFLRHVGKTADELLGKTSRASSNEALYLRPTLLWRHRRRRDLRLRHGTDAAFRPLGAPGGRDDSAGGQPHQWQRGRPRDAGRAGRQHRRDDLGQRRSVGLHPTRPPLHLHPPRLLRCLVGRARARADRSCAHAHARHCGTDRRSLRVAQHGADATGCAAGDTARDPGQRRTGRRQRGLVLRRYRLNRCRAGV